MAEQDAVLAGRRAFVKPGGRLIYVTCSLLAEENEDRVAAFLAAHPAFAAGPGAGRRRRSRRSPRPAASCA